ncbi:MAG TPA: porin family protein [Elusimicrobiales bacterium]|nr:porin family protein [Elusimicrobiales bacterium]
MKKILLTLCALLAMPSISLAGLDLSRISAGGSLGYAMPTGTFRDDYKGSAALGLHGEYKIEEAVSAGMEIGYNFSYGMKDASKTSAGLSDGLTKIWQFTPYAKVQHSFDMSGKKATAYGLFGAGLYNLKTELTSNGNTSTDSQSKFGWNVGGGLALDVAPQWSFGLDLRFHSINTTTNHTNYFTPSLRTSYRFK